MKNGGVRELKGEGGSEGVEGGREGVEGGRERVESEDGEVLKGGNGWGRSRGRCGKGGRMWKGMVRKGDNIEG